MLWTMKRRWTGNVKFTAAICRLYSIRTGIGEMEDMASSGEGSDDSDSEASPSTSGASCCSDIPKPEVPISTTRGSDRIEPRDQPSSTSSSSSSPAPSSPAHNLEEVQKEAEKECTADVSQNGSTAEEKCVVDVSQNTGTREDECQAAPAEAQSGPTESSQAHEAVRSSASDVVVPVGNIFVDNTDLFILSLSLFSWRVRWICSP